MIENMIENMIGNVIGNMIEMPKSRVVVVPLLSFLLICCSCGAENDAAATAEAFLSAYFRTDYMGAASFCSNEISSALCRSTEARSELDSALLAKMTEASLQTSFTISSVDTESLEGTAFVTCHVKCPDSVKPVEKYLTLEKQSDGRWLVTGFR